MHALIKIEMGDERIERLIDIEDDQRGRKQLAETFGELAKHFGAPGSSASRKRSSTHADDGTKTPPRAPSPSIPGGAA